MTKVVFLLMFLSSTSHPQYFYKGMYFLSMDDCNSHKESQIEKMTIEADMLGYKDVHIDSRCLEMDIKKFKPSIGA